MMNGSARVCSPADESPDVWVRVVDEPAVMTETDDALFAPQR